MATVAPVTGIELQADHCKCIHTDPDSALGKAGFERASAWICSACEGLPASSPGDIVASCG
jgi:hypothetical protein